MFGLEGVEILQEFDRLAIGGLIESAWASIDSCWIEHLSDACMNGCTA